MSGSSRLTPAQLAAAAERHRDGRPDKAVMSNAERRRAGLMDLHQAAEHEHLAAVPYDRCAERVHGPDPEDMWTVSDGEGWAVVLRAGHWDHGGWSADSRDGLLVCACGDVLSEPEQAAAG